MAKCGIYKIINTINNKMLIGLSSNILRRWGIHKTKLRHNKHENIHIQRSWQKYGEQSFRFEIILECPIENLKTEEARLIKENKTMDRNFGYNIMEGGHRPRISEETKQKMRLAALGRKNSEESKIKNRNAHIGDKNSMYGKHFSEETIQRFREIHTNISEETRQKLRDAKKGEKHNRWGVHLSEATKQKIKETKEKNRLLKQQLEATQKGNSLFIPCQ